MRAGEHRDRRSHNALAGGDRGHHADLAAAQRHILDPQATEVRRTGDREQRHGPWRQLGRVCEDRDRHRHEEQAEGHHPGERRRGADRAAGRRGAQP
jgi:hypothetical protein